MEDRDQVTAEFKARLYIYFSGASLLILALLVIFPVVMFGLSLQQIPIIKWSAHAAKFWLSFIEDPQFYVIVGAVVAFTVWIKLRHKYEKLVFTREGIRYVSPYGGPWSFLQALQPGWMLPWSDVDKVVVQTLSAGLGKHIYRLVIAPGTSAKQVDYPLSWQRLPWPPGPPPRIGRPKPDEMARLILQSPLVLAFKQHGVAIEEQKGALRGKARGYDIAQNRGLMTAVVLAFILGFYFVGDTFIAADYAYLSAPPLWPFVPTAALGLWCGWRLGKTAPMVERSVVALLLGAALAAALYPGMLRLNAFTATGGHDIYAYTQISAGNFSPPDAALPPIHLDSNGDYWGQFKNGSTHRFRVVHGALGFYQLDTGRVMDEVRGWWISKRPGG